MLRRVPVRVSVLMPVRVSVLMLVRMPVRGSMLMSVRVSMAVTVRITMRTTVIAVVVTNFNSFNSKDRMWLLGTLDDNVVVWIEGVRKKM